MLLPALNSARSRAKSIQCVGNLKQLGVASNMYMMDHKEFTVIFYQGCSSDQSHDKISYKHYWPFHLFSYGGLKIKSASYESCISNTIRSKLGIIVCPADKCEYNGYSHHIGYGINEAYSSRPDSGIRLSIIKNPSKIICFGDVAGSNVDNNGHTKAQAHMQIRPAGYATLLRTTFPTDAQPLTAVKHMNKVNACFWDGSAGSYDPRAMILNGKGDKAYPWARQYIEVAPGVKYWRPADAPITNGYF
jgi:prepilin-type processing-associated H-X9-DG protein